METVRPVRCSENEGAALYLFNKRQEMAARPNGLSENLDMTLSKAYGNICDAKTPIKTLKDLSQIKGVGKWVLTLMKEFFREEPSPISESPSKKSAPQKGKKTKGPRRYVPQKNSVAYALIITLYREMRNGNLFMKKQELIDAAEASGLSRTSIGPDKAIGRPSQFGSSAKDWYTGWSCMKTLVSKGLVVKSSCPAKYMLTDEGTEAAKDCISRSGLDDDKIATSNNQSPTDSGTNKQNLITDMGPSCSNLDSNPDKLSHKEPIFKLDNHVKKDTSKLRIDHVNISDSDSESDSYKIPKKKQYVSFKTCSTSLDNKSSFDLAPTKPIQISSDFRGSESKTINKDSMNLEMKSDLAMPPSKPGERFHEIYQVTLILDDRENFGSRSKKVVDSIRSQFNVLVEVRRLPVGDGLWVARHKINNQEYVLDFIVERKNVDDLRSSIRDNRYRDQKLRLQRCGLKKLIYLVEGDPNSMETADSIKTACYTTEILEGFDVQRTSGFADTIRKYGHLTKSITEYYNSKFADNYNDFSRRSRVRVCNSFDGFVKKCQDLERLSVSDVFALQLMQVPQVTEEIAKAVVELYPTLLSLVQAYSSVEGNLRAQEEMLSYKNKSIGLGASRNIFKLIWGS